VRLEVTRKSDLAVRALRALADHDGRMKANELAAAIGSTPGFVSQVVNPLVRARWVRSEPGPAGGYALAAPLSEISILAAVEAVEGPTDTGRCVLADRACNETGTCALHDGWMRARAQLMRELDTISVAEAPLLAVTTR
jgi:Rrf2 family protein